MALVLCTGIDPVLITTRQLILEQYGHKVVTATDESAVITACQQHAFDVAVIGQVITLKMKKVLAALIRKQCPSAKILELYPLYQGKVLEDADAWLEVPIDIPNDLAQRVNELARKIDFPGQP